MKKFALLLTCAGMLSLFACKSAPEQKVDNVKPDTTVTEQAVDTTAAADTTQAQ